MEKEQAINMIKQVCANYKGTLQEHEAIQQAVKKIEELEEKPEE